MPPPRVEISLQCVLASGENYTRREMICGFAIWRLQSWRIIVFLGFGIDAHSSGRCPENIYIYISCFHLPQLPPCMLSSAELLAPLRIPWLQDILGRDSPDCFLARNVVLPETFVVQLQILQLM